MRRLAGVAAIALLCTLLQGAFASAFARPRHPVIDPSRTGPHGVDQIDYHGGHVVLTDPSGMPVVEELKGLIYLPTKGKGPFPLLVFIHGRHATCRIVDFEIAIGGWPCPEAPPVTSDVSSYRGYDYLATNLASHGYIVVSVSANAINSYDFPISLMDAGMHWRARLVGETIDLMARWNFEEGPREVARRLIGKVDFSRIGLMGHSRGGEGVARFVTHNRQRDTGPTYKGLRAVFALAPTDFASEQVPGVHFGTIVPLCDGDVYDLEGAWMFDNARFDKPRNYARVQFAVNGANHNYFNTVWTFDDGQFAGDGQGVNPACQASRGDFSVRLSAREQRAVGLGLMAAFLRRYVGGEKVFDPLMTGAGSLPRRDCGRSCEVTVLTSHVSPHSRILIGPRPGDGRYDASGGLEVNRCTPTTNGMGCPSGPNRSPAEQLTLAWRGPGSLVVHVDDGSASGFESLTFRTAVNFTQRVNPPGRGQNFEVVLVDSDGRRASVRAARFSAALRPPAGPSNQQIVLNGTRIPLSAFDVALEKLARIELRFGRATRQGSIQLSDVSFQERR